MSFRLATPLPDFREGLFNKIYGRAGPGAARRGQAGQSKARQGRRGKALQSTARQG